MGILSRSGHSPRHASPVLSADSTTTFANETTVRGLARVSATTGSLDTSFAACDAVARINVNAADTTGTTGSPLDVASAWINYAGRDSFCSVVASGASPTPC